MREKVLGQPIGQTLYGSTVLIIGWGNIARELAPRLKVFGVKMIAARRSPWDMTVGNGNGTFSRPTLPETSEGDSTPVTATMPRLPTPANTIILPTFTSITASRQMTVDSHNLVPPPPDPQHLLDERHPWSAIPDLVGRADVIILTCNLTPETRGMIDASLLDKCKDGVMIVNVARGGLLDHAATLAALESGKIGGLGGDVQWFEPFDPEDPIAKHPKVGWFAIWSLSLS
jgi:phosphoglycerate dehydrogenase-like enzyme